MRYEINKKATVPLYVTENDQMKLNSNCPDSEKSGTGPGSCGGSKGSNDKRSTKSLTKQAKVPKSYYQTADKDQRDFDETQKDLTNSLLVRADKSGEIDAKGTQSIITAVDKSIAKLEKDLASTEKYYKDKLQEDDKDVGMNIFHMKNKIAIMKEINDDNKKFYKEKF